MTVEEPSFPRGGFTSDSKEDRVSEPVKLNLFNQSKPQKKKKSKAKSKSGKDGKEEKPLNVTGPAPHLISLDDLSYQVLTEGMLVLGRIVNITDYSLEVSLPGMMSGRVPLTQISEPYSQLLQGISESDEVAEALCPLSELFYKGQLVCTQVWQVLRTEDNKHSVTLSLDPRLVHSDLSHSKMAVKGFIVSAAVKSKEEHGYVMDCGVRGLRGFLKEEKALSYCAIFNGGRPLGIGQLVRCIVTRADVSAFSSNIELSADPEDVAKGEAKGALSVDLQSLLPGMRFKLSFLDTIENGIKVEFNNTIGFIHRNHLPADKFETGADIFGRVLYVTPMVKNIFLSVLPSISSISKELPKPSPAEAGLRVGEIVEKAEIIGVGVRGLFLQFKRKQRIFRGFVPERRMGFNYKGRLSDDTTEDSMMDRLMNKFPIGSFVRCRVLHFSSLIETFVCSLEKDELDERYHSWSDVNVGDIVPCVVEQVQIPGISVKVGKLSGFVPTIHTADVPLHQPALSYPSGSNASGRVLKVDREKHQLVITFKKSLVKSELPILATLDSAQIGTPYMGTVVAIYSSRVCVTFYGDVVGYLAYDEDTRNFFNGQVVKCYVNSKNMKALTLSLKPSGESKPTLKAPKSKPKSNPAVKVPVESASSPPVEPKPASTTTVKSKSKVEAPVKSRPQEGVNQKASGPEPDGAEEQHSLVGRSCDVEVTFVGVDCLLVQTTGDVDASGTIPMLHLSDDPKMSELLFKTMSIGTKISNACCFIDNQEEGVVFSMRYSVVQFFKYLKVKSYEPVHQGWIVPCTVRAILADHLLVECPLIPNQRSIQIPQELVCDNKRSILSLGLVEGQGINAYVMWVRPDSVGLSFLPSHVWRGDLGAGSLHLSRYLCDQQRLRQHAEEKGEPIGAFHVGQTFHGKVDEKTDWGFILRSLSGVRGEVTFFNAGTENLTIGSAVEGKVLYVDCLRGHVEVTLNSKISSKLEMHQIRKIEQRTRFHAVVVLVTPEFTLVQLKGQGNDGDLAFMPSYLDPYTRSRLSLPQPFFGIDRKVIVQRSAHGNVICLPKEVIERRQNELRVRAKIYFDKQWEKKQSSLERQLLVENKKKEARAKKIKEACMKRKYKKRMQRDSSQKKTGRYFEKPSNDIEMKVEEDMEREGNIIASHTDIHVHDNKAMDVNFLSLNTGKRKSDSVDENNSSCKKNKNKHRLVLS